MNKVNNKNNFALFFIIFLTSFTLGFIFSLYINKNIDYSLLKNNNGVVNVVKKDLDLSKFWEVYSLIKLDYFESDGLNKNDLIDSSIKGLVDGLGDKHSEFFNKKETEQFNNVLSGDFEGIGAVVKKDTLGVKIERLIKGSPAKKSGLKSGDLIIKSNGESLEGLSLFDAVEKIKGPAGTKVLLEILRVGEKNILEIEVIRDKIKIPSVETKKLENNDIGYISINMFGEETSKEFKNALEQNFNKKGLIIDLRYNGGGILNSSIQILSNFIEKNKLLVTTKYKNPLFNRPYFSINTGKIYTGKIVILINENSASASEIISGALKDYKKAILVGVKSYGKGSVQKPFILDDGSMLKLTVAKWFTPNNINIDYEGINPDIEVHFKKEDYTPEEGKEKEFKFYDRQLEVAKKVLKSFIDNDAYKLSIDKFLENNKEYKPEIKSDKK
ncbi:S41 family peptidase [Candidatus Gracilibacteria bacterium]|nr:S41 family peptidase [Candidatus Gracilibacteria bacterium]